MIVEKIGKTIEKYKLIERGDHIVLGLSGGPDSVCLFHVLMRLSDRLQLTIHPVHLNHKFRPGDAEQDQQYVEELCRRYGLVCRTFVKDCNALAAETGMTSEEAGRAARYEAFYQVAAEVAKKLRDEDPSGTRPGSAEDCAYSRVRIAVAQNANDQAETILFRILRGTGTDGLAGIAYKRKEKQFTVIRPLLDIYREEIEEYCRVNDLRPVTDHTNNEELYTRNRIRLKLLPYLAENHNENILEGLNRLGRIAAADKEYIWQETEAAYRRLLVDKTEAPGGQCGKAVPPASGKPDDAPLNEIVLDRAGLHGLHPAIRHRVMMKAFRQIGLEKDISEERLAAADKIIGKKQAPKTVQFPYGYAVTVAKGRVHFTAP